MEEPKHLPSLSQAFEENVRPFIDLIDKLRLLGLDKDISLPEVAVIGDQSAGKSSVLEAISGVQLPRGSGKVAIPSDTELTRDIIINYRVKFVHQSS